MNVIWSSYVQGVKTLYYSRKLRFDDMFMEQYRKLFALDEKGDWKILEIGCGPGALAGALHRWYPNAKVTGIDRDSEFVRFAKGHEEGPFFVEGDATALPFADQSFDVVISNTVSEHVEPSGFYGEQLRVLKEGGVCLVLSSRKGIRIVPDCAIPGEKERKFWDKAGKYNNSMEKYAICKYPMSEAELPAAMERYGFREVSTGYVVVNLTPDDPKYPEGLARDMIEAERYSELDAVDSVLRFMPEHILEEEAIEIKRLVNARYDVRVRQYERGEKQWDTNVSMIFVVRGVKHMENLKI